jgi:hypothetical protein
LIKQFLALFHVSSPFLSPHLNVASGTGTNVYLLI